MKYRTKLLLANCIPIVVFAAISLMVGFSQFQTNIYAEKEGHLKSAALAAESFYSSHGYGDYGWKEDGNVWRGMNFNVSEEAGLVDDIKEQTGADITFFFGESPVMTSIRDENNARIIRTTLGEIIREQVLEKGNQLWCPNIEINGNVCQAYIIPIYQEDGSKVVGAMMASQTVVKFNQVLENYIMTTVLVMLIVLLTVFLIIRWYVGRFSDEFKAVRDKSRMDLLTGLYNKHFFEEASGKAMAKKKAGNVSVLLIFDLDDFKEINDVYGHQIGDEVLKAFAHILFRAFRTKDILGRIGGDEFMAFMPDMTTDVLHRADEIAQEVLDELAALKVGDTKRLSCSIGIGTDAGEKSFKEIYSLADRALYEAKKRGKACYVRQSADV